MRLGIVYLATAPSGKRYVGRTVQSLSARISAHKRGGSPLIYAAIAKYGDAMRWRVLAMVGVDFLSDVERFYIRELQPEYNLTPGGEGGNGMSYDIRAKISAKLKGRKRSPEECAAISAGSVGRKMPPITENQRMERSLRAKRLWRDPLFRAKMVARAKEREALKRQQKHCAKLREEE